VGKVKDRSLAISILVSKQCSLFKGTSVLDIKQSIASFFALAKKLNQTIRLAEAEIPNVYHGNLMQKADILVTNSPEVLAWKE
jgi:hypothetical protein